MQAPGEGGAGIFDYAIGRDVGSEVVNCRRPDRIGTGAERIKVDGGGGLFPAGVTAVKDKVPELGVGVAVVPVLLHAEEPVIFVERNVRQPRNSAAGRRIAAS